MNSNPKHRTGWWVILTAAVLSLLAAGPVPAQNNPPEKAVRQIKVMEGIIDQVLTDSPNFEVFGHENVHGVYLNEFGAVFTFEASLTDQMSGFSALRNLKLDLPLRIETGRNGKSTVIEVPGGDESDSTADEVDTLSSPPPPPGSKIKPKDDLVKIRRDLAAARHKLAEARAEMGRPRAKEDKEEDPAELYRKGKAELVQTLLDYGDTITSLRDDQWIALAAFLKDSSYFLDNRISRLVLKARARDLRDYAAGRIPEPEMRRRIVEEQY